MTGAGVVADALGLFQGEEARRAERVLRGAAMLGAAALAWETNPLLTARILMSLPALFRKTEDPILGGLRALSEQIEQARVQILEQIEVSTKRIEEEIRRLSAILREMLDVLDSRVVEGLFKEVGELASRIRLVAASRALQKESFESDEERVQFWKAFGRKDIRAGVTSIYNLVDGDDWHANLLAPAAVLEESRAALLALLEIAGLDQKTQCAQLTIVMTTMGATGPVADDTKETRDRSRRLAKKWGLDTPGSKLNVLDHRRILQIARIALTMAPAMDLAEPPDPGWFRVEQEVLSTVLDFVQVALAQQALSSGGWSAEPAADRILTKKVPEKLRELCDHPYFAHNLSVALARRVLAKEGVDAIAYGIAAASPRLGTVERVFLRQGLGVQWIKPERTNVPIPYVVVGQLLLPLPDASEVAAAALRYPPWVEELLEARSQILGRLAADTTRNSMGASEPDVAIALLPALAIRLAKD